MIQAIQAEENYGQKQLHGLHWGIHRFNTLGWKIKLEPLGGNLQRLENQNLKVITPKDRLVVMCNIWSHKDPREATLFRHPNLINQTGADWWYWDNPSLPHLLYKGEWNPNGYKNWMRLVKNATATQTQVVSGEARINAQLDGLTDGNITAWQEIVGPIRPVSVRTKTALLCPSGAHIFPNYYNTTKQAWVNEKKQQLENLGWRVIYRDKPSRSGRERKHGKLYEQLIAENIGLTVSMHSTVPIESLLCGVPSISAGAHSGGELVTPWEEFLKTEELRLPTEPQIFDWVNNILGETFHKSEVYDGTWKQGE
tara:strand:+ start:1088 stop:2020 length:933 start_codon:yes stop_codon:yes gene_type:complete